MQRLCRTALQNETQTELAEAGITNVLSLEEPVSAPRLPRVLQAAVPAQQADAVAAATVCVELPAATGSADPGYDSTSVSASLAKEPSFTGATDDAILNAVLAVEDSVAKRRKVEAGSQNE